MQRTGHTTVKTSQATPRVAWGKCAPLLPLNEGEAANIGISLFTNEIRHYRSPPLQSQPQPQHQSHAEPLGPVSPISSPPLQQEERTTHAHGAPLPPPYQQQPPQGHFAQAGPLNHSQGQPHPHAQTPAQRQANPQGYFVPGPQGGQANHFIPLIPITEVRETPALVDCPWCGKRCVTRVNNEPGETRPHLSTPDCLAN